MVIMRDKDKLKINEVIKRDLIVTNLRTKEKGVIRFDKKLPSWMKKGRIITFEPFAGGGGILKYKKLGLTFNN